MEESGPGSAKAQKWRIYDKALKGKGQFLEGRRSGIIWPWRRPGPEVTDLRYRVNRKRTVPRGAAVWRNLAAWRRPGPEVADL